MAGGADTRSLLRMIGSSLSVISTSALLSTAILARLRPSLILLPYKTFVAGIPVPLLVLLPNAADSLGNTAGH